MTNRKYGRSAPSLSLRTIVAQLLCSTMLTLVLPTTGHANPQNGHVAAGSATIVQTNPQTLTINQGSQKAIINWQSFSIGTGETTSFNQPDSSAITLNRVTGVDPASIMGNLNANGQVWLVNPNGIAFSKSARVDVAGLLATTIDISNRDFLSGDYRFSGLKNPSAMVSNAGQITVRDAGLAALVAPGVENSGVIQANLGQIQLSSTAAFTVDLYGDGLFNFALDKQVTRAIRKQDGTKPSAAVSNSGTLIADGGKILLTANAAKSVVDHSIDMTGYAQATSASVAQNGEIVLDGGSEGTVQVAGTLDASGAASGQTGGNVHVTGQDVQIASTAKVDVSGNAGGGTALIGGDMHGTGTLRHASTTTVASGATINADAVSKGNGGEVVVWSDKQTDFHGTISARGSAIEGNGGSAEVSSHGVLSFNGLVDLRAVHGVTGSLLLDPENVTITSNGDTPSLPSSPSAPIAFSPAVDNSVLSVSTLQSALALADVTVSTGTTGSQAGDITVASNVSWSNGNTLTLSAYRNITINDGVTIANTGAGNLNLHADNTGTGIGTVTFNGTGKVDFSGSTGTASIFYNPADNPAGSVVNATSYTSPTVFSSNVLTNSAVTGQLTGYMLVNSVYDLQNVQNYDIQYVQNNLLGDFALGRDIDASVTAAWNGGSGFIPIGGVPVAPYGTTGFINSSFRGKFEGSGHVVSGLVINSPSLDVGLFGVLTGTVENITVSNAAVASTADSYRYPNLPSVGGLVGINGGTVENTSFSGSVSMVGFTGQPSAELGGLVGVNYGVITSSHASGSVYGSNVCECGGLVGYNADAGLITTSYATNTVGGDNSVWLGGLVSTNSGSITQSYANGTVTSGATGYNLVGGLVADETQTGSISNSYATGSVGGGTYIVGGLVAEDDGGSIFDSYAAGAVSSSWSLANDPGNYNGVTTPYIGGLVAYGTGTPKVTNSYWDTQTTGQASSVGGTGLTDAQLKAGLPSGFDSSVWAQSNTTNNAYPYLKWQIATAATTPITVTFGNAAPIPVTWTVANASSTYGTVATFGSASLLGVLPADDGLVTPTIGLFSDNTQVSLSSTLPAGTYTEEVIVITGTAASHYTLSATGNTFGTLTINPKALTWSVTDASFAFGSAPSIGTATLSGIVGSDDVHGIVEVSGNAGVVTVSPTTLDGFYTEKVVGLTGIAAHNYSLASTGNSTGTLTIYSPLQLTSFDSQTTKPVHPILNIQPTPVIFTPGAGVDLWSSPNIPLWQAAGAALPYAKLAYAIYSDQESVDGWTRQASWIDILVKGLYGHASPADVGALAAKIGASGFDAAVYAKDGHYVLVFRGTVDAGGWLTDVEQLLGIKIGTQYDFGLQIAKLAVAEFGPNLVLTGHSLGGGIAQYVVSQLPSNLKAITFNAAGMSPIQTPRGNNSNIVNVRVIGDPVSEIGHQLGNTTITIPNPVAPASPVGYLDPGFLLLSHDVGLGDTSFVVNALSITWADGVLEQTHNQTH